MIEILRSLFNRDLQRLKEEIAAYNNEALLWRTERHIANSAGNLCLHLIGNLNTYFGSVLGNTGYVRQRDLEFSQKDVPQAELLDKLDATAKMVNEVLDKLQPEALDKEYPMKVYEQPLTTAQFLAHLTTHLAYHLGQINYHRRLLEA